MKFTAFFQLVFSVIFLLISFLFIHAKVFAVTVTINQSPTTITQDTFTITASISGATSGTNYVRIDLYREGSTNYFGETYNGSDWYSGSDYHQYLAVPIVGGQWTGTIQGSLGSPSTTSYDGSGTYRIRIRRYTGGGTSNATEADNSSVSIQIVTPTPTPTPLPTSTPAPTNTPTAPATIRPSATTLPTAKISATPLASRILAIATESGDASDDGSMTEEDITITPTPIQKVAGVHTSLFPGLYWGLGGVMFIGCGILFVYKYRLQKDNEDTAND